jgi:hypothetical protein
MQQLLTRLPGRVALGLATVVLGLAPALVPSAASATDASIWGGSPTPATTVNTDETSPVTLGVRFYTSTIGQLTAVKMYRGAELSGDTHVYVYETDGTQIASGTLAKPATFTAGWRTVNLSSPINLRPNHEYIAAYFADNGLYASNSHYFCAGGSVPLGGPVVPQLDTNCSESGGHNGLYSYSGSPHFPDSSYHETNYWVDVVFNPASISSADSAWSGSATPATGNYSADTASVVVGTRFHVNASGYISHVKFYRAVDLTGDRHVYLWDSSGNLLGEGLAAKPSSFTAGWQTVELAYPVSVAQSSTYTVGYLADNGNYAYNDHYFCAGNGVSPELDTNCSESAGHNGVYNYSTAFPTSSFHEANYWVDVIFQH